MIDGTIDKETFNKKKIELNKKIKKIEKDKNYSNANLTMRIVLILVLKKLEKCLIKKQKILECLIRIYSKH